MKPIERWRACVHKSVVGAVVPYVRRNGGPLIRASDAPSYVRQYLNLTDRNVIEGLTFDEVCKAEEDALLAQPDDEGVRKVTTRKDGMTAFVHFDVKNPYYQPPRPRLLVRTHGPLIRNFRGLLAYFDAGEPRTLNRHVYKATECGASISVLLAEGASELGTWVHNGDRRWAELTGDETLRGFTLQTIVEGSEATVDSDLFRLPCTQAEVATWIAEMETQADELWHQANDQPEPEPESDESEA